MSSRVAEGEVFRIAPTRCTGPVSKARSGCASSCSATATPIFCTVVGLIAPVWLTA